MLTLTADAIARQTYDAFMRGKRLVVPGFANKVAAALPRFLPRGFVLRAVESYQRKNVPKAPETSP
jgi:short-subunit dehydrogenase